MTIGMKYNQRLAASALRAWAIFVTLAAATAALATPWYTQDPRTLKQDHWRIEEHVIYSTTDSALSDGDDAPLPGGAADASSLTALTRVRYGVTDNVTVFMDVPWVHKRVHPLAGGTVENDGMGDLFFLAKWKYYDDRHAKTRRAVALSVKTDTGEVEGLPGLLATGTGGTNWNLTHLWEKQTGRTTWYNSLTYSLTGRNRVTGVDPGNLFLFNLAAEHHFADHWNFVWEVNGRYQGHFVGPTGTTTLGSSTLLSLTPGVQFTQPRKGGLTTFEAGVQIPVVTNGDQPSIPDYEVYAGAYTIF